MNRKQKKQKEARIRQQQKKEKPLVGQVEILVRGKQNYINKICAGSARAKQKIVLTVLISLLLFILFLQYEILWIPFCIAACYSIIPISEFRYLKKIWRSGGRSLKRVPSFLGALKPALNVFPDKTKPHIEYAVLFLALVICLKYP